MLASLQERVLRYVRARPAERKRELVARLTRLSRVALRLLGPFRPPLALLARISGTDKIRGHSYIPAYERLFAPYRGRKVTLLEIGVGGAGHTIGGHSLNLWEAYLRRATVVGIDIVDKTRLSGGRIHVHQCSQVDRERLRDLAQRYGGFDIVIDDGSHVNQHQIESFEILFPLMKASGIYVVEDVQTSYWPAYGGSAVGTPGHRASAMAFFQKLTDGVNHAEYLPSAGHRATAYDRSIKSICFEHNLIVVVKGDNTEPSNVDVAAMEPELSNPPSGPS